MDARKGLPFCVRRIPAAAASLALCAAAAAQSIQPDVSAQREADLRASGYRSQLLWIQDCDAAEPIGEGYVALIERESNRIRIVAAATGKELGNWAGAHARVSGSTLLVFDPVATSVVGYALPEGREAFRLAAFPNVRLGPLIQDDLYWTDAEGLRRVRVSTGQSVDLRPMGYPHDPPVADGGRVYVRLDGHEFAGLDRFDFSKGWRSYCDGVKFFPDEQGFVGSAWYHRLFRLDRSGKPSWPFNTGVENRFFAGQLDATGGRVVAAGCDVFRNADSTEVLQKVYCFDRFSGRLLWQRAMEAELPAIFGNRVAIFAGHALRGPTGEPLREEGNSLMQWTLDIRDLESGRLLAELETPGPAGRSPQIFAVADVLFVFGGRRIRAYR